MGQATDQTTGGEAAGTGHAGGGPVPDRPLTTLGISTAAPRRPRYQEIDAARRISGRLSSTVRERHGLRVGVVCDTSEAGAAYLGPALSLAWVVMRAAHQTIDRTDLPAAPAGVTVDTLCVGTGPGAAAVLLTGGEVRESRRLPPVEPGGGQHRLDRAVETAIDGARLTERSAGRLLVMITSPVAGVAASAGVSAAAGAGDGRAVGLLQWARTGGCGVLWLCPATEACHGAALPGQALLIDPDDHLVAGVLAEAMREEISRADPIPRTPPGPRAARLPG